MLEHCIYLFNLVTFVTHALYYLIRKEKDMSLHHNDGKKYICFVEIIRRATTYQLVVSNK